MEVKGKIKMIGETQTFGSNGFQKREVVVTTEEQYPQNILIEFVQDKCNALNNYKVGDLVTVSINLRGREWVNPQGETKYFNSIQGWKIAISNDLKQAADMIDQVFEPAEEVLKANDDLPFN